MWREHKKLWKKRTVAAFVVAGLLLNLFLILRSEYGRDRWTEATVSCYRSVYREIKNMQPEKAKRYLEKKSNNQNVDYLRRIGYSELQDEISHAGSYDDYLDAREQDYSQSEVFDAFRKTSKYDRKDAAKVMEKLRRFRGETLAVVPSRGWHIIFLFFQTDIAGLMVLFAAAAISFMQEKERGEYVFIRTMKRGRGPFILQKAVALMMFTAEVLLLLYLENILVAWRLYGLGDLACMFAVRKRLYRHRREGGAWTEHCPVFGTEASGVFSGDACDPVSDDGLRKHTEAVCQLCRGPWDKQCVVLGDTGEQLAVGF